MRQAKSLAAMALNAYSFIPIDLGYVALSSVVLQCRTAKDVYISTDPQGTNYFTLKSGTSLSLDLEGGVLDINAGSELVTNGACGNPGTGWTFTGGQWSFAGGNMLHVTGNTGACTQTLVDLLTVGALYLLAYDLTYNTAGITPSIGGVTLTKRTATATYYEYLSAVTTARVLTFTPDNLSISSLDNISFKRITYPSNQRPLFVKGSEAGLSIEIMAIQ